MTVEFSRHNVRDISCRGQIQPLVVMSEKMAATFLAEINLCLTASVFSIATVNSRRSDSEIDSRARASFESATGSYLVHFSVLYTSCTLSGCT